MPIALLRGQWSDVLVTLYLSFSRAGWFCRFGLLADRRPVSVLRFKLQCTRCSSIAVLPLVLLLALLEALLCHTSCPAHLLLLLLLSDPLLLLLLLLLLVLLLQQSPGLPLKWGAGPMAVVLWLMGSLYIYAASGQLFETVLKVGYEPGVTAFFEDHVQGAAH